nr:5'-nucleotidase C-terminal domain-containing protein [Thermoleophilaceae bacterium]
GADVAFVNPGNMRANVHAGAITYEDLFAVAPYEHEIMKTEMRGADILRLLAQQATPEPAVWLHVSGMRWELQGGLITNVVMADGRRLEPGRKYTVAANEMLAGTPRFSVLAERGHKLRGVGTDFEALVRHVKRTKGPIG